MGLSVWQILIIVLVVVLLFGAGKIPRLAKDLGSGVTAFRRGLKGNEEAEPEEVEEAQPAIQATEAVEADKPAPKKKTAAKKKPAAAKESTVSRSRR